MRKEPLQLREVSVSGHFSDLHLRHFCMKQSLDYAHCAQLEEMHFESGLIAIC